MGPGEDPGRFFDVVRGCFSTLSSSRRGRITPARRILCRVLVRNAPELKPVIARSRQGRAQEASADGGKPAVEAKHRLSDDALKRMLSPPPQHKVKPKPIRRKYQPTARKSRDCPLQPSSQAAACTRRAKTAIKGLSLPASHVAASGQWRHSKDWQAAIHFR